jgi:hypothetical protein
MSAAPNDRDRAAQIRGGLDTVGSRFVTVVSDLAVLADDLAQDGSCGYWHSPEGQTRRQRCREINRRLDGTRPPLRRETIRRGLAESCSTSSTGAS